MKNMDATSTTYPAVSVEPIGIVQSPYKEHADVAHKRRGWTEEESVIRLFQQHADGLEGLEGFSHIIVLFYIHRANEWRFPEGHEKPSHIHVFATRMPRRPVPIGMSVVQLRDFSPETGEVHVLGLDALDGTPVLDIKPYIHHFDSYPEATLPPWVEEHMNKHHEHSHEGHHAH